MVSDDDGGDVGEGDGILRHVGLRRSAVRNARAHIRHVQPSPGQTVARLGLRRAALSELEGESRL